MGPFRFLVPLALLLTLVTLPAAGEPLTLDQAVQEALNHGYEATIWAANKEGSRAVFSQAQARAGLTLAANAAYGATKTFSDPSKASDDTIPENGSAGLTLSTPLTSVAVKGTQNFQQAPDGTKALTQVGTVNLSQVLWNGYPGGPAQASYEKALQTLQVADLNAQASKNKLILAVKQSYFTLLSAQEALTQLTLARDQRVAALTFAQTKFNLGQATALDLKQASINSRTSELDLVAGQSAQATAARRLALLLGRSDSEALTVDVAEAPNPGYETLEEAIAEALKRRVEPQVARANLRSAQIDTGAAFGAAFPTVALTSGVTWTRDQVKNQGSVVATLGVTLVEPVWDGGLAGAQFNQAESQRQVAEAQYRQSLESISIDVSEAWNAWMINQGRLEVAANAVEVAEGQRTVIKAQFDAGSKTLADAQAADVAVSAAQQTLLKAKITAQLSALTLQSLLGL